MSVTVFNMDISISLKIAALQDKIHIYVRFVSVYTKQSNNDS